MSNSSLVNYTRISPNRSVPRNQKISKLTVHHMAGNLSVETCGNVFASSARQASSNYGIGSDGRVGMYVEEKDRAWTSSSSWNDNRAVTIEVANDQIGGNWHVSDAAWNKLVELCVDICKRNGMTSLTWTGDKNGSLTCHYMFAATNCPGPYLKSRMAELARTVTARLGGSASTSGGSSSSSSSSKKSVETIAKEVIAGKWGNGTDRKAKLEAAGYNYNTVQAKVNELLGVSGGSSSSSSSQTVDIDALARRVINGEFGNGDARKKALGSNYDAVQKRVNEILSGKSSSSSSSKKSVDTIAREVIAGKWGNGATRKQKLEAAGYDYNAVQKRVNQLL